MQNQVVRTEGEKLVALLEGLFGLGKQLDLLAIFLRRRASQPKIRAHLN